ncbi:MAG: ComEC/Rec2 family competence protein, partial [Oscillospiraceae bacterium]|nr:ComEC/Rec2 family competence protein [Oscillospiraceae bacterium]
MKRPAIYIGFLYILGLITASIVIEQFRIVACVMMIILAIVLLLINKKIWKYVLFSTLSCVIACCSYWHCENMIIKNQVNYIGKEVVFTGNIASQIIYDSGYAEYILTGYFQDDNIKANIKLFCENQDLNYGDEIIISGVAQRIQSNYIFDSETYYQAKQIFLEFDITTEILEINISEYKTLKNIIYNWRANMTEKILSHMDSEAGAMLTGMLFGDKSSMRYATKKALYRTGIGHILAVSGLHLDFLAGCVLFLLKKCKVGRKLSFLIIMLVCSGFVLCAG